MPPTLHVDWDGHRKGHKPGTAAPIVLLHGFAGDTTAWDSVREALRKLGPTLAVDLPGHGGSATREDGGSAARGDQSDHSLPYCLEALESTLAGLGIGPAWWMGYSMGGRVALAAAVQKPHLVRGLVLESATAGLADTAERRARRESDEALARRLEKLGLETEDSGTGGMAAFVADWLAQPLFASLAGLPPDLLEAEKARRLRQHPGGLAASLRGMGTGAMEPLWDALPGLAMPTLILAGEQDAKFTRLARRMAGLIPGAQLRIIEGAGHIPHLEQPRDFLAAVGEFLSSGV